MTDEDIADIVYIEPLPSIRSTRIIERERPDGLLPTLGGQTGLNLAVELADAGVLEKYNVRSWARLSIPFARPRTVICSKNCCFRSANQYRHQKRSPPSKMLKELLESSVCR